MKIDPCSVLLCRVGIFLSAALVCSWEPAQALPPEAVQRQDEACLQAAYPDVVDGLEREGEVIWLRLRDGRRVIYADDKPSHRETDGALADATVSQSMAEPYPAGAATAEEPVGDPGRERSTALLRALYGAEAADLKLQKVAVGKESVRFAASPGAAEALRRVADALKVLAADPAVQAYIHPLGGGQYWRNIAGTKRLSAHSFGIAIDLNPRKGAYWRWKGKRPAAYPQAIVDAFEANGFIWGGRWEHFDAMHFEYRPELLCKARVR